jgi:hypothetical protein
MRAQGEACASTSFVGPVGKDITSPQKWVGQKRYTRTRSIYNQREKHSAHVSETE